MINKKFLITTGFTGLIIFGSMASMQQQQEPQKPKNLKVLPKNFTTQQVENVMHQWTNSLGVRCNFCHERGNNAADTKPEKLMAREMFKMTAAINKKYFKAEKDSLGIMAQSGVACYTCHRGSAHPEVTASAGNGGGRPDNFGPRGGGGGGFPQGTGGGGTPPGNGGRPGNGQPPSKI